MKLDSFLIGFVLFSVFIVGGVFLIGGVNTAYNYDISTSEFNETYDVIDDMYDLSQDMKGQTLDADIDDTESWESMTKGSYSAVRLVKNTFALFGQIAEDIGSVLHIPPFFVKFAMTALTISIIFGVIYLFMRFRP